MEGKTGIQLGINMNYDGIINYFKDHFELKIFYERATNTNNNFGIMYIYSYPNEIEYFRDTFGSYFPLYIMNQDLLETYLNVNLAELEERLNKASISSWSSISIFPRRDTRRAGVYGELFLDFYLRVVNDLKPLITYASKRSYRDGRESTGIDNVVFDFNNSVEMYLCESKFVSNRSNAKNALLGDINGSADSESHFTEEYINGYFEFVMKKSVELNIVKVQRVLDFIQKVNIEYVEGRTFLEVAREEQVTIHAVLFAIYKDTENNVDNLDDLYSELGLELARKLDVLNINYTYEIVFIPTTNTSLILKEGIDSYYE